MDPIAYSGNDRMSNTLSVNSTSKISKRLFYEILCLQNLTSNGIF